MASSSQIVCASSDSSPSSDPCWKYDVFLSFRGVDTRKGITADIHDRLTRRGITTFMDDRDLEVGDAISSTLLAAIKESRFAIVVLSQNYASSTWCLEELREICSSMEDNRILPLFYHVDPTAVRYQKESFEEAFSKHETSGRHESEKVKQWRDALYRVAGFSGWNTNDYKTHKELVDAVLESLGSKVLSDAIEFIGDFQAFKATRQAMDEIMKAVKADEVTVIGVYGMGGVGKTTMVKHVGAHARKSGIVDYVIMGVVSQNPDLERLQCTLAELLGLELHEKTEIGRAHRLSKEIQRRKNILIILDDIWNRMDLSDIGIPNYKELQKCNSKVLLTTRRLNVCHAMKCQETITLNVLSEQDSWTLFMRSVGKTFESTTFTDVARKVVRECCGLPIALITIARALGDKDLAEWKSAAQGLKKSQTANPDDYGEASRCIKLSYDYLKDEDYRSYLLLCCLYPEDYNIPIKELFRYGIGRGLFRDADTLEEARERAHSATTHLKHSCLLLDSEEEGCVKMHDVVRDTAIQIAQSDNRFLMKARCGLREWPRQVHEGYSAVSLMENHIHKLPDKLVCPKLQVLLLNHNWLLTKIPKSFFQRPNDLRVLNLSYTIISLLPQSLSLLTDLRALHLDKCRCEIDISIIRKLKRLEILSVRYSNLKKFSRAIGGLTNLKILDMTGASIDMLVFKLIPKLHNLEELCMYGLKELRSPSGFWNKRTIVKATNAGFYVVTRLSKVRVVEVWISDAKGMPSHIEFNPDWVEFNIYIGTQRENPEASNRYTRNRSIFGAYRYGHRSITLKLDSISLRLRDWFINTVMNIAERLQWEGCKKLIDIFVEYEHGSLHALKHLSVYGDYGDVYGDNDDDRMNTTRRVPEKAVLENLEELHLEWVNCMKLFVGGIPYGSLFNLKLWNIGRCYNWGNVVLLPSRLLETLPNLEKLSCRSMEEIEYVFGCAEFFEPKQSKLRKIELCNLNSLRSICHGSAPAAMFQTLQSLTIHECGLQGSLFSCDVAQCLSQLNYLEIQYCLGLERIVEASNVKIILPKLKELILMTLPRLYYQRATFDIECPSLEDLELRGCPKFVVSLSDFHSRKNLILKKY